jgi:ABC-2 type transport system ATP-binding protein
VIVVVENLRKRYAGIDALRGVSFEVREGEIFGMLGPNGAGKTTAVECIIGLREPDDGRIEICGLDARRQPRLVKQRIGASLQTTALQDKITPREALTLFGSFYDRPQPPAALLDRFGLAEKADASFDSLSGGQRQRLALALAFVNNPELVFLDEPTTGLDAQSRRELHEAIAEMKHDGHTVMLTTHDMAEAEALCDRLAIIDRGRIVAEGSPHGLMAQSRAMQTVTIVTVQPVDAASLGDVPGATGLACEGTRTQCQTRTVSVTVPALLARLDRLGIEILELHAQKATLEDVFLELTGSSGRGPQPS